MVWAPLLLAAGLAATDAALDTARVEAAPIPVSALSLERGDVDLELTRGVLYPVRAGDAVVAAVFLGDGTLAYHPPSSELTHQLRRELGPDHIEVTFESAVLRFSPTVFAAWPLAEPLSGDAPTPSEADRIWQSRRTLHHSRPVEKTLALRHHTLVATCAGATEPSTDFLYVEVHPHPRKPSPTPLPPDAWLAWMHSERTSEEQRLLVMGTRIVEIGRFHDAAERAEYGPILLANERAPLVEVTARNVDVDAATDAVTVHAHIEAQAAGRTRLLELAFDELGPAWTDAQPVHIERLTAGGQDAAYVHHAGRLLVELPVAVETGEIATLDLTYRIAGVWTFPQTPEHAEILGEPHGLAVLPAGAWLPSPLFGEPAPTTLTVCAPDALTPIASGTRRRRWRDRRRQRRCVRTTTRDTHPAFVAAAYTCKKRKRRGGPRIEVCTFPEHDYAHTRILERAHEITQLYQDLFGAYPGRRLTIAELPAGTGNVTPEHLALLSAETFLSAGERARLGVREPHLGRHRLSHELAHAWWGHHVRPKTYHDDWLAESMAEYASALYLRHALGKDAFNQRLSAWRERATRPDLAEPLYAGGHLAARARTDVLMNKGPWVVHMLRHTMGDGDFQRALVAFNEIVGGRRASTEDFQAVCEKVHGSSLQWFFNAWIKSSGVPRIEYEYRIQESERTNGSGKRWEVIGTIRTEGLEHPIKIPVVLYFEGRRRRVLVPVPTHGGPFRFTDLPQPPQKVSVDANALLAQSIQGGKT